MIITCRLMDWQPVIAVYDASERRRRAKITSHQRSHDVGVQRIEPKWRQN